MQLNLNVICRSYRNHNLLQSAVLYSLEADWKNVLLPEIVTHTRENLRVGRKILLERE